MKILMALFFLLPSVGFAKDLRVVSKVKTSVPWRGMVVLGSDSRFERDQDQMIQRRSALSFGGGAMKGNWIAVVEHARFSQSTGAGNLTVHRELQSTFLWGYWQSLDFKNFAPFLGGGVGIIEETVQTTFMGISENDKSPFYWTGAGSAGLRLFPSSSFWLSGEGRLYKNPHLDPDPQLGFVARVGWVF